MYALIRRLLFCLPPEAAHFLVLRGLQLGARSPLRHLLPSVCARPRRVMGLDFPNPVGLAAGLDKNGEYIDGLAALGFGFIEVGTVTPRPQPGNPRPRLFRVPAASALVNRMGFNNAGVEALLHNIATMRHRGILGINIGKNRDTPAEHAAADYLAALRMVYPVASYVTVNLSSPNTPGLRDLQFGEPLRRLLAALKSEQQHLAVTHGRRVPLLVKIAPDMADEDLDQVATELLEFEIDGVIATNTTIDHSALEGLRHGQETGGVSGAPLMARSTEVIRQLHRACAGQLPIIGAGGIMTSADALAKLEAGASLVQVYTGLIYRGPTLVRELVHALPPGLPEA